MKKSSIAIKNQAIKQPLEINIWALMWAFLWGLLIFILVARVVWLQQVSVVGASMEPNYYTNELLFVDQIDKDFERGRVVAVYQDKTQAVDANYLTRFQPGVRFLLKRIIGLPGEDIEIRGSQVIIYNDAYPEGAVLQEDYISDSVKREMDRRNINLERQSIPKGEYYVMGDNRNNSSDSRDPQFGTFPDYAILGQEFVRAWPLETFHFYQNVLPTYRFEPLN